MAAVVFFRDPLWSEFDAIFGDGGDARFLVYINEHLYVWLSGRAQLGSPNFFYPQPNVLGYSEALLLYLLPYSIFRMLGFDLFLSFQLTIVALSFVSFFASVALLHRYFRIRLPIAIATAILIVFPNSLYLKAVHAQFFAIYFLPIIGLIGMWAIERFPRITWREIAGMATASFLFALLFSTGFYVAWLFSLTALIAGITAIIMLRKDLLSFVRSNSVPISILLAVGSFAFLLGLVPFAWIYSPAIALFPKRPFSEYLDHAPTLLDIINVSQWNLVWGSGIANLTPIFFKAAASEKMYAITPGVTALFFTLAWLSLRKKLPAREHEPFATVFVIACVVVFWATWLLTVRVKSMSAFWLLTQTIPGAGAIRAGGRAQIIVNLWIASGLGLLVDRTISSYAKKDTLVRGRSYILIALMLLFCLIEQVNSSKNSLVRRSEELLRLEQTPPPRPECGAFAIMAVSQGRPWYLDQIDAMLISQRHHIPTLNGYSAWTPPDWALAPQAENYIASVQQWVRHSKINVPVCLYDPSRRIWLLF